MTSWKNVLFALERGGGVVFPFAALQLFPICGLDVGVLLMLRPFGGRVVEMGDRGLDVTEHGGMDF